MKSTMKSAFAFIAVAMMIMVAVVPMVSVFTESSDAATGITVDPELEDKDRVIISVGVYKDNGAVTDGKNYVKVVYTAGNGAYALTFPVTSGTAKVKIAEKEISGVKLTYVDKDGVAVPNYGEVSMGTLKAGDYSAKIVNGMSSKTFTLFFSSGEKLSDVLPATKTITGTYDVYTSAADDATKATSYKTGQAIDATGVTTVYYPVGTAYVFIKNVKVTTTGITSDATAAVKLDTVNNNVIVKENVVKIQIGTYTETAAFTVTSLTDTVTESETVKKAVFTKITDSLKAGTGNEAIFTTAATAVPETVEAVISVNGTECTATKANGGLSVSNLTVTFLPTTAALKPYYGTVTMNTSYAQEGKLTIAFTDATSSVTADVDKNGAFFVYLKNASTTSGSETKIKTLTFGSYTVANEIPAAGLSIDFTAKQAITLDGAKYSAVTGDLKYGNATSSVGIVGKTMSVGTGIATFGSMVTGTDGKFDFLAETGKVLTLKPTDSATINYTGDISAVAGTASTGLNIYMGSKTVSLTVTDALGNDLTTGTVKLTKTGATDISLTYDGKVDYVWEADVQADLDMTGYTVSITSEKYTFAKAPAFVDGSVYAANEATYDVTLYKADGITEVDAADDTDFNVYTAMAYKNSLGSIVYYDMAEVIPDSTNKTYLVDASYLGKTKADITSTPVKVLVLGKIYNSATPSTAVLDTKGIFEDYYVLEAVPEVQSDLSVIGEISIVASVDSFSGKLLKNDGVTPVAGALVTLKDSTATTSVPVRTQADGTFKLYSSVEIKTTDKLVFSDVAGYTFNNEDPIYSAPLADWITEFEVKSSTYTVSFVDADGAKIALKTDDVVKITATTLIGTKPVYSGTIAAAGNVATFAADWNGTETLSIALTDKDSKVLRTFEDIELKADELAAGKFTVTSDQSTYTFSAVNANGDKLPYAVNAKVSLYRYYGGAPVITDVAATTTDGYTKSVTMVLPLVTDDVDTVYGYVAEETTSYGYVFSKDVTEIADADVVVKSLTAKKTISIQDAAGKAILKGASNAVTLYANGEMMGHYSVEDGKITYNATEGVEYTCDAFRISAVYLLGQWYNFDKTVIGADGVIKAEEETVYGSVTDAAGKFVIDEDVTVKVGFADGSAVKAVQTKGNMSYSFVGVKADIKSCQASVTSGKYTFELSATADIKANETGLLITLKTVNGVDMKSLITTNTDVTLVMTDGTKKTADVDADDCIIVNAAKVSEYQIADPIITTAKITSKDGAFVSSIAAYEGSVGATTGTVVCKVYKGTEVVDLITVTSGDIPTTPAKGLYVEDNTYLLVVDTTVGDKFVVTNTVTTGTGTEAVTKTYSAAMNTGSKVIDLEEVISATALKANVVKSDNIDYEVSADGSKIFLLAAKTYTGAQMDSKGAYSDGHDLVEKFRFDGWYVNGSKVSGDVNYTAENKEGDVIVAYYVSDGYYETNKPVEKSEGNNSSVMIIGIAAVIIALIAVVYAVIQKKQ